MKPRNLYIPMFLLISLSIFPIRLFSMHPEIRRMLDCRQVDVPNTSKIPEPDNTPFIVGGVHIYKKNTLVQSIIILQSFNITKGGEHGKQ